MDTSYILIAILIIVLIYFLAHIPRKAASAPAKIVYVSSPPIYQTWGQGPIWRGPIPGGRAWHPRRHHPRHHRPLRPRRHHRRRRFF